MQARDYIRRKDNHAITALVICILSPELIQVQGPYSPMTGRADDWEKVPPVSSELTNIWRYSPTSGGWNLMRDTYKENAERWLQIMRQDEPGAVFKASKRRPVKPPKEFSA